MWGTADLAEREAAWKVISLLFFCRSSRNTCWCARDTCTHNHFQVLQADHTFKLTYVPFNQCMDVTHWSEEKKTKKTWLPLGIIPFYKAWRLTHTIYTTHTHTDTQTHRHTHTHTHTRTHAHTYTWMSAWKSTLAAGGKFSIITTVCHFSSKALTLVRASYW